MRCHAVPRCTAELYSLRLSATHIGPQQTRELPLLHCYYCIGKTPKLRANVGVLHTLIL